MVEVDRVAREEGLGEAKSAMSSKPQQTQTPTQQRIPSKCVPCNLTPTILYYLDAEEYNVLELNGQCGA